MWNCPGTLPVIAGVCHGGRGRHGLGLHPQSLIAEHLADGSLVELVPDTPLDVPLHWHYARAASALVDGLSREVMAAARTGLLPP